MRFGKRGIEHIANAKLGVAQSARGCLCARQRDKVLRQIDSQHRSMGPDPTVLLPKRSQNELAGSS
jgi:hypothetical protein